MSSNCECLPKHFRDHYLPYGAEVAYSCVPLPAGFAITGVLTRVWLTCTIRKTTSFLSRLIPGKKKDRMPEVAEDEAPEPDAPRMSIEKLSPLGFIPQHPGPAKYIRTRAHGKREKEFHRVFLAQELLAGGRPQYQTADRRKSSSSSNPNDESSGGAIWALSFSKDGKYLAAAGQDKKIRIWAVISAGDQREDILHGDEPTLSSDRPPRFQAPVFHPKPMRILEGHTGTILDLSWSKVSLFALDRASPPSFIPIPILPHR